MSRIIYWKCRHCHGTGEAITVPSHSERCFECDGTGNAMVDGRAAAHRRQLQEIETNRRASAIKSFTTTRAAR